MLYGNTPGPLAVYRDVPGQVTDADINLNTNAVQREWFDLPTVLLCEHSSQRPS
jgi:hypothetical protein